MPETAWDLASASACSVLRGGCKTAVHSAQRSAVGEAHTIRQMLGHTHLPQFVGDM